MLSQAAARNLGRKIKASLKADRVKHAATTTALDVEGCLAAGEFIEAWHYLKRWYRLVEDQAPKPCPDTLAKQTKERIQLYATVTSLGRAMRNYVDPSAVPDMAPTIFLHQAPRLSPWRTSRQGHGDNHYGGQAATTACVG